MEDDNYSNAPAILLWVLTLIILYTILLVIFLSSAAEASHGDYNIRGTYGINGPVNPAAAGATPRPIVRRGLFTPFPSPLVRQEPIWPSLPVESVPYSR